MRGSMLAMVLAVCAACSHTRAHQIMGPDGSHDWYLIRCRGDEGCFDKAEEVCPGGYELAEKTSKDGATVLQWSDRVTTVHPIDRGRMLIKCR
jgi:hypothetical protein